MRVYLLGAGASKAYDQSPTRQRMPIARDFFETFDRLELSKNPWVLQNKLHWYLASQGKFDPQAFLRGGIDIEALHSQIAEEMLSTIASADPEVWGPPYGAYNELIFLFASVLNEIQNGPISKAHLNIARSLGPQDGVITFNWDTLMDRALEQESGWRADFGYGVSPHRIFENGWRRPAPSLSSDQAPKLIKLHGSTNWLTAYPTRESGDYQLSHTLDPSLLNVIIRADEPYPCYAGRYMHGHERYSYGYYPPNLVHVSGRSAPPGHLYVSARAKLPWVPEGGSESTGLVSMPLIIPPVKNKDYDLFGTLFKQLWSAAESMLVEANEIVVIGYSFPKTDLRSIRLFADAFLKRREIPKVVIIDPAPDRIAERFWLDFGIPATHLTVIRDYFSDSVNLDLILR